MAWGHCWRNFPAGVLDMLGTFLMGCWDVLGKASGRLLEVNNPIRNLYKTNKSLSQPIQLYCCWGELEAFLTKVIPCTWGFTEFEDPTVRQYVMKGSKFFRGLDVS